MKHRSDVPIVNELPTAAILFKVKLFARDFFPFLAEYPEDRPICNVNGTIYRDGEYFDVPNEPDLTCICQKGYKGKKTIPVLLISRLFLCHLRTFALKRPLRETQSESVARESTRTYDATSDFYIAISIQELVFLFA